MRRSDAGATLAVGLDSKRVPYTNLFEGYGSVPCWATFSSNGAGRLVLEEVHKEVVCCLEEVRDFMSNGKLVDC